MADLIKEKKIKDKLECYNLKWMEKNKFYDF